MPGKKPRPAGNGGAVMVILEEIRSQNRATIEAVEGHHQEIRRQLQDVRGDVQAEMRMVRSAVQAVGGDVQQLKVEVAALKEQVSRI